MYLLDSLSAKKANLAFSEQTSTRRVQQKCRLLAPRSFSSPRSVTHLSDRDHPLTVLDGEQRAIAHTALVHAVRETLAVLRRSMSVCFRHVPKHRGVPGKELADLLADLAIKILVKPLASAPPQISPGHKQRVNRKQEWPSAVQSNQQQACWRCVKLVPDPVEPQHSSRQFATRAHANLVTGHGECSDAAPQAACRLLHFAMNFDLLGLDFVARFSTARTGPP